MSSVRFFCLAAKYSQDCVQNTEQVKEDIEENSRKEKGKRINEIPSGKDMEYAEFL